MDRILSAGKNRILVYEQKLRACSPYETLRNGYAFVTDEQGRRVGSIAALSPGEHLNVRFEDGTARVAVEQLMEQSI